MGVFVTLLADPGKPGLGRVTPFGPGGGDLSAAVGGRRSVSFGLVKDLVPTTAREKFGADRN